jgi:putative transposase
VFSLRPADTDVAVAEVCCKMGISEATYYNWKKKYGGLDVPKLRGLKQLEEGNQHLKQLVSDLSLDKQMLQNSKHEKIASHPTREAAGRSG